jgi:hypothetical protein
MPGAALAATSGTHSPTVPKPDFDCPTTPTPVFDVPWTPTEKATVGGKVTTSWPWIAGPAVAGSVNPLSPPTPIPRPEHFPNTPKPMRESPRTPVGAEKLVTGADHRLRSEDLATGARTDGPAVLAGQDTDQYQQVA